jgi:hypothetical protein
MALSVGVGGLALRTMPPPGPPTCARPRGVTLSHIQPRMAVLPTVLLPSPLANGPRSPPRSPRLSMGATGSSSGRSGRGRTRTGTRSATPCSGRQPALVQLTVTVVVTVALLSSCLYLCNCIHSIKRMPTRNTRRVGREQPLGVFVCLFSSGNAAETQQDPERRRQHLGERAWRGVTTPCAHQQQSPLATNPVTHLAGRTGSRSRWWVACPPSPAHGPVGVPWLPAAQGPRSPRLAPRQHASARPTPLQSRSCFVDTLSSSRRVKAQCWEGKHCAKRTGGGDG